MQKDKLILNCNTDILISVVITTFNRSTLLIRALTSVINQTYKNLEIIIVDDCSMDETRKIIIEYMKIDSRITYIKNTHQSGSNFSRNQGILASKGKFIAGLDDDDEFLPNRIELLIKNYDCKYAAITSNNIIDDGETQYSTDMPNIIHLKKMLQSNIAMNQGLIERKRLIEIGLFDITLTACQDYDVWIRLMLKYGNIYVVKEPSQIIYMEKNRERISSSKNVFLGNFSFYKKYKYLMRDIDKKTHLYKIYQLKQKRMSILTEWILSDDKNRNHMLKFKRNEILNDENLIKIFKEYQYQSIISSITNLNYLNEIKTPLIIYGFGTIGKFIYKYLNLNIIGIIDKDIPKNDHHNLPIIDIGNLVHLPKSTILVTPIIHFDAISQQLLQYPHDVIPFTIKSL